MLYYHVFAVNECKTWFLTPREEHRLRMFEKSEELRYKRDEMRENLEDCIMRFFKICTLYQMLSA